MKKLLVIVTLALCGAAIILGNLHWNNKISAQGERVTNVNEEVAEQQEETVQEEVEKVTIDVTAYASHLPSALQEKIKNAVSSGTPVQLVIYGTSEVEGTWSEQFKSELVNSYGKNIFEVTVLSTREKTTRDIVKDKSYLEINELKPDAVLFEAPMLEDNGSVGIANTLNNIQTIIDVWQKENPDLVLMVQPPNPLYDATYYPSEVSQLKDYAEKYDMNYVNHWETWPELDDKNMLEYLDQSKANEKGHKLWADHLINYFVAK